MQKIFKIKNIMFLAAFLLLSLPSCYMGGLRFTVLTTIVLFLVYAIFFLNNFVSEIIQCIKLKISKQILYLFLWISFSGLLVAYLNVCSLSKIVINICFRFIPLVIFPYFLGYYVAKHFSTKTLVQFYYALFLFIFFIGFVDFVFSMFHIPLLQYTIVNHRSIGGVLNKATYLGISRVQSVFDEPSYMGWFLAVHLPIMYQISKCKFKIFSNNILNFISKKLSPIFAWIMIFLGMSPMFIFIFFLETMIYRLFTDTKNYKKAIIKIVLSIIIIVLFLMLILNINLSGSFLNRIQQVIKSLTDVKVLIFAEPSLGNRILCYIASFSVFLHHPFIGVGFGNAQPYVYKELLHINLPLTMEIQSWLINPKSDECNYAIFWTTLAENGLVGIILLYNVFFTTLKHCYTKIRTMNNLQNIFLSSLFYSLIVVTLLSIYDSGITLGYIWFLIGILAICLKGKIC